METGSGVVVGGGGGVTTGPPRLKASGVPMGRADEKLTAAVCWGPETVSRAPVRCTPAEAHVAKAAPQPSPGRTAADAGAEAPTSRAEAAMTALSARMSTLTCVLGEPWRQDPHADFTAASRIGPCYLAATKASKSTPGRRLEA